MIQSQLVQQSIDFRTFRWNALVTKKMRFVREEGDSIIFLHATKGFRAISKKRLGL